MLSQHMRFVTNHDHRSLRTGLGWELLESERREQCVAAFLAYVRFVASNCGPAEEHMSIIEAKSNVAVRGDLDAVVREYAFPDVHIGA